MDIVTCFYIILQFNQCQRVVVAGAMAAFKPISDLSDEEPGASSTTPTASSVPFSKERPSCPSKRSLTGKMQAIRSVLARLVTQNCPCGARVVPCLKQFRPVLDDLFRLRLQLRKLAKQDMDNEVVKLLSRQPPTSMKRGQVLLGKAVCQAACRKLLGLGSARYTRLRRCAMRGETAPLDGRTITSGKSFARGVFLKNQQSKSNRGLITEFLEHLYHTRSEPMPEAAGGGGGKGNTFRKVRGKRPREAARYSRAVDRPMLRLLPPGNFTYYFELMKLKYPGQKFSLKLFTNVWSQSFHDRLAIRGESHHSQCGVCLRHRLLIKKLSGDALGREQQLQQYNAHLDVQYRDRTEYWRARAASQLYMNEAGRRTICLITDAIDHCKFRYPRSQIFRSKDLSHVRPTMDLSCVIAHGRSLRLYMSEPWVKKDSSWCAEIVLHSLNQIQEDLRTAEVILQSDNCCRETKNNTLCRLAGMLCGLHRVHRMELRFLQKGHSHEDVDQFFSSLASMLEGHPELWTPNDFKLAMEGWLADRRVRQAEPERGVHKVDCVRDWTLRWHWACPFIIFNN